MATKYFENKLNIKGISFAKENAEYWYFLGGSSGEEVFGEIILSVFKGNGQLDIVEMPSHESIVRLRKAKEIADI